MLGASRRSEVKSVGKGMGMGTGYNAIYRIIPLLHLIITLTLMRRTLLALID